LSSIKNDATAENLLEIWTYEACRLFKDRLVGNDAQEKFDQLIDKILKSDWTSNALASLKGKIY
jgi:dynein heavy chain 2